MIRRILSLIGVALFLAAPAVAGQPVTLYDPTNTHAAMVDESGYLRINCAAGCSGSTGGVAPTNIYNGTNGFGTGITGTSSKFALTGAAANSVLVVTNSNTTDTIYVLLCPTSTCTATALNGIAIGPSSTASLNIGANTYVAGISSGTGPDVTYVAAGTGIWAGAGGGSGGGGTATITGPLGNQTLAASVAVTSSAGSILDLTTSGTPCASYNTAACRTSDLIALLTQEAGLGTGVVGSAYSSTGSAVAVAGYDGTNLRFLKTDSSGDQIVVGAGTAGSASGGVVTIQGVASMTPVATNIATNNAATGLIQATASVPITFTAAGGPTQIIAANGSTKIYVTHLHVVVSGAGTFALVTGTGTNCGTGTTYLEGAASHPLSFAANGGISEGSGVGPIFITGAGGEICAITTGAVDTSGAIAYAQF